MVRVGHGYRAIDFLNPAADRVDQRVRIAAGAHGKGAARSPAGLPIAWIEMAVFAPIPSASEPRHRSENGRLPKRSQRVTHILTEIRKGHDSSWPDASMDNRSG